MLSLEKTVSQEIIDNIRKTLVPYLGLRNFQISVATRLNTDKKQTNETIYNPDSRVERSVRVMKQNQVSQNSSNQTPATVQQNVPQQNASGADGKQSNEENTKREELTNYEVSSKTVTTVSGGFSIDNLSVAVLVNKSALAASLGDKATPDSIKRQIGELEQIVASAAGAHTERGDTIKIAAVDFIEGGQDLQPVPPPAWTEMLMRQSGTVINAGTILLVAILLVWFGLRPATKALLARPEATGTLAPQIGFGVEPSFALPEPAPDGAQKVAAPEEANLIEDLTSQVKRTPQRRLEQIVEFDEEQAAAILRQWMQQGGAA
jgi:flagellar M-ring protein FliF